MSDAERIQQLETLLQQKEAELKDRDAKIAQLERKLQEFADAVEAFKRGHRIRPGGKLAQKPKKRHRKPPGRKKGHPGTSRFAPKAIDRTVAVPPPTACPGCGGEVVPLSTPPGQQRVEEVVPGYTETIAYLRHQGRCRRCGKRVRAKLPEGLGHNPKLGVAAQAAVLKAKTELHLTLGQLKRLMATHYGLAVSRGGLQQVLHRAAQVFAPAKAQLQEHIRQSGVVWTDDTSLRVLGESGYLWLVMTREAVLFEADRSRGKEVPQRLFTGFSGIAHSDFYGSYFAVKGLVHATCWAHLLREARQLAERQPSASTQLFFGALTRFYQRAVMAQRDQATVALVAPQLRTDLLALAQDAELGRHREVRRLQGRLTKFCDDLLRFVTDPRLEGTNNRAERELRPVAMARHVGGGARSDEGARTYAMNLSVARTAAQQRKKLEEVFRAAREAYHNGADFPPLLPNPA